MNKKSTYRTILIVMGLLHILFYFILPYTRLEGIASDMNNLAGELGALAGTSEVITLPEKLTGLAGTVFFLGDGAQVDSANAEYYVVSFLMPAIAAVILVVSLYLGKGKPGQLVSILSILAMMFGYYMLTIESGHGMQVWEYIGYESNATVNILMLVTVVELIICIIGRGAEKRRKKREAAKETAL